MKKGILLPALIIPLQLLAQKERAYNWVFGDSTGINFSSGSPVPFTTGPAVMGENAATISDEDGNLKFYLGKHLPAFDIDFTALYNANNQIIENDDSIASDFSINSAMVFLPKPGNQDLYCLIYLSFGVPPDYQFGILYSLLEASAMGEFAMRQVLLSFFCQQRLDSGRVQ